MARGYKDVGFESVSLPLELFAADAVYDVSEEGLVFSEKDFLASSVELASDTVYCLKFTIKTSATYMTVTLGNTEIVTFDGEGILSFLATSGRRGTRRTAAVGMCLFLRRGRRAPVSGKARRILLP